MTPRVVIVGGGVAGLTLAALLYKRRFTARGNGREGGPGEVPRVVVLERVHTYRDVGYVLGMWGNGLRILKGIGVYERLMQLGSVIDNFLILDENGEKLSNFELDDLNSRFEPAVMVKRAEVLQVLYEYLQAETDVDVRMNTTISAINHDERSALVTLSDGSAIECDIVVGADGIRSATRQLAGFGEVPLTFWNFRGCGFWVDARECENMDTKTVIEMWGPDGQMFGIYPHGDNIVAACCTLHAAMPDLPDPPESRIAHIRKEFAHWGGPVPSILNAMRNPKDFYSDDLCELTMDREMYQGRVVLIGDAAHAILPTAGAGAALAMESAGVLAEELCWCDGSSFDDVQRTFRNYQQRRGVRVDTVRRDSNTLADAITWSNPAAVLMRNLMMKQASPMTFSKKMLKLMYDPI